ncbi:MAG: hypothetical protein M1838_000760 [Thelocarpon superellum]|nr:MAG: hypothetical protein M1838_000760 [Thelocarpon superellum]
MSKAPHRLSSREKYLRQRAATTDPFVSATYPRVSDAERVAPLRVPSRRLQSVRLGSTGQTGVLSVRRDSDSSRNRQASLGAVWSIGGSIGPPSPGPVAAVPNGRGGVLGSGTNAPMYTLRFQNNIAPDDDLERHEARLALAMDVDQTNRVFDCSTPVDQASPSRSLMSRSASAGSPGPRQSDSVTTWRDNEWRRDASPRRAVKKASDKRPVPFTPFRVLDAPQLRDDFYCSLLAYSATAHSLAVGLNDKVFIWSEMHGVQPLTPVWVAMAYVTSLSFSSTEGGFSILAIGRSDGQIALWSLYDEEPRFEAQQPSPVACLSWRPSVTPRTSERQPGPPCLVPTEELLAGDEAGNVYYYSVEWSPVRERTKTSWHGAMTLLARISVHAQQICGLAWSRDGEMFATGGNDNVCCLFETHNILAPQGQSANQTAEADGEEEVVGEDGVRRRRIIPGRGGSHSIEAGHEKYRWVHGAAVKAIAFCPWQRSLIASGGGSNDRCIHFYHTTSGACLATINVAAQVTSLLWSTHRREIAATFGYAQPEHPYRIAVFTWPECRQVVAIPWLGEMRALYAIAYPGGPNQSNTKASRGEGGTWTSRTTEEGCIVVAGSDESVKFHEVWTESRRGVSGTKGILGGSDILESLEGIEDEAMELIR